MRHRVVIAILAVVFATSPLRGQTGKSFMWKVEGEGGSVAYLLGSLHVLTPEWYPLNASINKALVSPELKKFLDNESAEAWIATPQQLANLLPTEIERYRKVAKAAGIPPQ